MRIARPPALILLALFAWLAATAWVRPLALPDEGRYVGVAWEMLWRRDWLMPTLDTLPYFHKPPLFYWTTATFLAVFGNHEWAARLTSLLAASGCGLALYLFMRRWSSEAFARLTLLALATTPFFFGGAQFANLDMLAAACIACTILCAADAVLAAENGRPRRATLAGAYLFAALGVLSKGLIGIAIPGLVIVAWLVAIRQFSVLWRLAWLPGLLLFGAIAAPWFALMESRHPGFLNYFFVHHHFQRYMAHGFNSERPFWFYVPVFAGLTLPWFIFLPRSARRPAASEALSPAVHALLLAWLIAPLIFFSIPSSKLIGYVLLAVPPSAGLAALGLVRFAGSLEKGRTLATRVAVAGVVLCGAILTGLAIHERHNDAVLAARLRPLLAATDDRILAMRDYPFSLPFYLRLRQPIQVVDDWNPALALRKDNWRKELYEAAQFDPARGRSVLRSRDDLLHELRCSEKTLWLFGLTADAKFHRGLEGLELVAENPRASIWRRPAAPPGQQHPPDCGP